MILMTLSEMSTLMLFAPLYRVSMWGKRVACVREIYGALEVALPVSVARFQEKLYAPVPSL